MAGNRSRPEGGRKESGTRMEMRGKRVHGMRVERKWNKSGTRVEEEWKERGSRVELELVEEEWNESEQEWTKSGTRVERE